MSATALLARRNLARNRIRLIVSIGGVALALTLVLALDAIFEGVSRQLTTYIDRSGADVWVAQSGVRNLHMVASFMPAGAADEVRAIDGVEEVEPILYATDSIVAPDERTWAYVIGLPAGAGMGVPWQVVEGSAVPGSGEVVIDRGFARRAGVGVGDVVTLLGRDFRIGGLSDGTANLVNSVAFVAFDDFAARRVGPPVVSFLLVRVAPGADSDAVAGAIERGVDGVTAQSSATFARAERQLVLDMSGDVIAIMNVIGFIVGLTVVALTVYVATLGLRREYGALKALGARNRFLYGVVLAQAAMSVGLGFVVGLAITAALAALVPRAGLNLELAISAASLAKVGGVAVVIAGLAAILPIRQIAGLDPAVVFRRGAAV